MVLGAASRRDGAGRDRGRPSCATPSAFAIAALAVLPLRLPVQVGDETNFLLVPLYGVIAGGWLRGAWLVVAGPLGRAPD